MANVIFVYGDPKYYGRFGFSAEAATQFMPPYELKYPFGWQARVLHEGGSDDQAVVRAVFARFGTMVSMLLTRRYSRPASGGASRHLQPPAEPQLYASPACIVLDGGCQSISSFPENSAVEMAHRSDYLRHTFPGAEQFRTHFSTQVETHMVGRGLLAGGVLVALMLAGCGGTTEVVQPHVNVSVGQQLIDLKKARDAGALTESEFQRQKEQLIDSVR